jgi:subtilisin family serine protease
MRPQLIVSIALLCATVSATTSAAQSALDEVVANLRDIRAARANAKIQSQLLAPRTAAPSAGGLVAAPPPLAADGSLHVYLDCSPLGANELMKLEQAGARIEHIHLARGLVQAWVEPSALPSLAALSWVRSIRPVDRAVVRTGSITTEGDAASRADVLRARGLDGTGVVVGVISDGIDSLADAQATNNLPDVVVPNDNRCQKGAGDEGTALLEIVHDVAPGAKLLFSGPSTSLDMVAAVQCLVDAGANVIVDDLGFFGEPYFEDGPVADAVSAAVTAGVSYHSSAGNEAQEHVEEDFFPAPGSNPNVHDWAAGAGDAFNGVVVPAQGTLTCILQWNDPFGAAADDYDLALFDANLNLVGASTDAQVGAQDPIEIVQAVNQTNTDQLANILVTRVSGVPRRLELFCLGAAALEHGSAAGSIFGHAALPSVVAVGAIDVHDPGLDTVEPFSSHGPARIDFPTPELRAKPDLVAFDGVAISNAGGFPACPPFCAFFGTSAAAPHSAGVAALLLDLDPTLTPAEVKAALAGGAVDVGAPGFDDASGFGRLDAVAAADTLTDSTSTSTTTTSTSSTRPSTTTTSTTRPPTTSPSSTTSSSTTTSTSSSTTTTRAPTTTTTTTVPTTSTTTSTTTTRPTTTTTNSTTTSSTTSTSLVATNTPPSVSIDDLPDKVKRKDIGRDRLLTLHITVSEPATVTLDILNGRGVSLRRTTLTRTSAGSFETQISLRHVRGRVTLRVTATDAEASSVVEQKFKAQ